MRSILWIVLLTVACTANLPEVPQPQPAAPPDPDTSEFDPYLARGIERARRAVLDAGDSAAAWGSLGMLFHAHDLMEEAAECYLQAMRLDPTDFRWPYLVAARHDYGKLTPELRMAYLMRAHALNPHYSPLSLRIADLLMQQGRPAEAQPYYQAAYDSDPESSGALFGLARIAIAGGDLELARAHLEEARWQDREHREVYRLLTRVYSEQGHPQLADRAARFEERAEGADLWDPVLEQVVRHSLRPSEIRSRAESLTRRGDFEQAIELMRRAVEVEPDDLDARQRLAQLLAYAGDVDAAEAELRRVNEIEPGTVDARRRLERWRGEWVSD